MNQPRIICHILQSIDGNIDGAFFGQPETMPILNEYSRIREEYACDAIISGATTAAEIYADGYAGAMPESDTIYPRADWRATAAEKYAVVVDGLGTLHWHSGTTERRGTKMHVITVLQESVSNAYIAHLRKAGVSYLFAGKEELDLSLAVQKLHEQYEINSMLLSGGGVVDYAFLQAGLIDEISLVIPPVIDGGTGLASAFDDSSFAINHSPASLKLIDLQRIADDGLWLRYGLTTDAAEE